ncbi:hypothetical protein NDU88_001846 [Pleurodeles waltl]|uniref:4'-phosphopantetheinyl transferase superfamily protein n=1 Tax=Pleurodeles waltl TaxID=8319 RepID=A0AAV7Q4W0_PLEWA|nr:hypothetical protein NDU88_001846 [Pleurodeles waltl]
MRVGRGRQAPARYRSLSSGRSDLRAEVAQGPRPRKPAAHRGPARDWTAAGSRGGGRPSSTRPGGSQSHSQPPGVGTSRQTGAGRRKGLSLRGAEAADTPRSLFRAWATAEVARSVVWGAGLTPVVAGDPQLFKAFQEPG